MKKNVTTTLLSQLRDGCAGKAHISKSWADIYRASNLYQPPVSAPEPYVSQVVVLVTDLGTAAAAAADCRVLEHFFF